MPERTYRINYDAKSAAQAKAETDALCASVLKLDAALAAVAPKLKSLGRGADKALGKLAAQAAKAGQSLNGFNATVGAAKAAVDATTASVGQLGATTSGAGRRMGSAANKAATMANAVSTVGTAATATGSAIADANPSVSGMGSAMRRASTSGVGLHGTLLRIGVGALGLKAGREVLGAFADTMKNAHDYALKTAEDVHDLNDKIRELRAITGDKATTQETSEDVQKLMLSAGMKKEEAIAFNAKWGSVLNVAKKSGNWNLDAKEEETAKMEIAKYAISQGIDPDTAAQMGGTVGIVQPVKTANDVLGQVGFIQKMGVEAVGRFKPLMKDFNVLAGTAVNPDGGGPAKSSAELMGIISALSGTSGTEAKIIQEFKQDWRNMVQPHNKTQEEFFKKRGMEVGKEDFLSATEKIGAYLDEEAAKGIPAEKALADAGFTQESANEKIIATTKLRKVIRENVMAAREEMDPNRVIEANKKFKAETPERFAKAAGDVAELQRGKEMSDLVTLRKFAEAGGVQSGDLNRANEMGVFEYLRDYTVGFLTGDTGRERSLDSAVADQILKVVSNEELQKRMPELMRGRSLYDVKGQELAEVHKRLSADEKAKTQAGLEQYSVTGKGLSMGRSLTGYEYGDADRNGSTPNVFTTEKEASMRRITGIPAERPALAGNAAAAVNPPPPIVDNEVQKQMLNGINKIVDNTKPGPAAQAGPAPGFTPKMGGGDVQPRRN